MATAVLVSALSVTSALGASLHIKGANPTCTATSTTLSCSGALAGLGNAPVTISVTSPAEATFLCTNKGGNSAPGQNKVPFTATGGTTIQPTDFNKNGTVNFGVSAPSTAPTATSEEAGCPNGNWTTTLSSVTFTGTTTLTITQGNSTITCTGPSPSEGQTTTLTCS